ncbi:uncharacterized protein LOC111354622 [Spodoptera litura]|uniref:Uncharacterized protein LOC111354622 n=1 Tax=Spodoptera litura TaxID=69820 RepID=A0A9J7E9F6_SPOLT|nr:uncharacterized protein LOC111354622 [Spodoptera litura]
MKKMRILFLLLLVKICISADDGQTDNFWSKIINDGSSHVSDEEHIVRPCALHDLKCIQRYFVQNSQCELPSGPTPDSYRLKRVPMYLPHVNVTFILTDADIKGFKDYKIVDFYVNKKTDTVLFEVELHKIWVYSPRTIITYHRKGKEPLDLVDYAYIEYLNLSLTLTAPQIYNIDMSNNHVYTYVSDAHPRSGLGPIFTHNKDEYVRSTTKRLLHRIALGLQEAFVTQGEIFFFLFFQSNICTYYRVFGKDFHHEHSIVRPCAIHDVSCIREFFAYNTQCSMTEGPAPDPFIPEKISLNTPHANLTFTLNNPRIKGLNNWKIKEFYINKATGVLVLEVRFSSIVVHTPKCIVTYYRKGKESLHTSDFTEIEYKDLSMTLTIPDLKDPQLSGAHVFTYVPDGKPEYVLGPEIYKTEDPGFQKALIDVESKVDTSLVELFVTQGPILFSKFFQSSICEFAH